MTKYWKILLIILMVTAGIYTGMVTYITQVVSNFNHYVVVYFPSELIGIFMIVGVGIMFKIYQSLK